MQVKNKVIIETVNALASLEGTKERIFKFSATTTYQLAKMLRRLKDIAETIEKARVELVNKHGLSENRTPTAAFATDYRELMELTNEVAVTRFKLGDLNLETNAIPVNVLADIDWLIIDEEPAHKQ